MLNDKNSQNQTKIHSDPLLILAPMDDVTDSVFRQIVTKCAAPDLLFTEFVNVDGLQSPGRNNLLKKIKRDDDEKNVIAQIWGKNPENFYKTAKELVDMGFSGVDINMGCPVKVVVNNGCGSGLMNNRQLATEIIQATKAGVDGKVPVSVKTRLGFNSIDTSWHELLLKQGLDMLTIHGRTRKEMSKVPANWEVIGRIREIRDEISPSTLIVGNGDIGNRSEGLKLVKQYKLDGVMIGRGVFNDPFIFSENSPWPDYERQQKIQLFLDHVELFNKTWENNERKPITLNKFSKIYINGFEDAKSLRETVMKTENINELIRLLKRSL